METSYLTFHEILSSGKTFQDWASLWEDLQVAAGIRNPRSYILLSLCPSKVEPVAPA